LISIQSQKFEVSKFLLEQNTSILTNNISDEKGLPLLFLIVSSNNNNNSFSETRDLLDLYLSKGGDLHVTSSTMVNNGNALHYCLSLSGNFLIETLKYLIENGIDFKFRDKKGRKALEFARETKQSGNIIEYLEKVEKR